MFCLMEMSVDVCILFFLIALVLFQAVDEGREKLRHLRLSQCCLEQTGDTTSPGVTSP